MDILLFCFKVLLGWTALSLAAAFCWSLVMWQRPETWDAWESEQ